MKNYIFFYIVLLANSIFTSDNKTDQKELLEFYYKYKENDKIKNHFFNNYTDEDFLESIFNRCDFTDFLLQYFSDKIKTLDLGKKKIIMGTTRILTLKDLKENKPEKDLKENKSENVLVYTFNPVLFDGKVLSFYVCYDELIAPYGYRIPLYFKEPRIKYNPEMKLFVDNWKVEKSQNK